MLKSYGRSRRLRAAALFLPALCWLVPLWLHAQTVQSRNPSAPKETTPSEGELAIKRFQVGPGLKVELWAAEPLLANPVAFNFDERGRAYVCETYRIHAGVDDIREIKDWLDEELASRSVDDRLAEMKRHLGDRLAGYTQASERVRLIEDRDGDGRADHATLFAEGFNTALDGIGAGVLARQGRVWYANIPNLWLLQDTNGDGQADTRRSLHYGFGVRVGFYGHDLHGLTFGPDGKLYFSVGDRGASVKLAQGRFCGDPDTGSVFRCNRDGSELEVFATGLRNPQDLVFDQYGNLFTGDNNSDSGDRARWVYLVEGGDSGWRVGYQFMESPYSRGPFNAEKLWYPAFAGQAAYLLPPIANIASGPSGLAYFPGTGLPERYRDHFFLADFRGAGANSTVHTFKLKPKGASFELVELEPFIRGVLATDVKFGVDGGLYVSDWVEGWGLTGKGRIYRIHDPLIDQSRPVLETRRLLAEGMEKRSNADLARCLGHDDRRVRQEAQFTLAARGEPAIKTFLRVISPGNPPLARLHAIWGLGQITAEFRAPASRPQVQAALDALAQRLGDDDPEVRAQAARVLGERRQQKAANALTKLLRDPAPRVRFFAAMSLGKLGLRESQPHLLEMLRQDADQDPYLRHAVTMALTWIGDTAALMSAASDHSTAVRLAVLLAWRRLGRAEVALFLNDADPAVVLEAARAINDQPINGAMHDLARLLDRPGLAEPLARRVLNANFRVGTFASAQRLAAFAARAQASDLMRSEALDELADWPRPSSRDRVVGLWRPLAAPRLPETALQAIQPALPEILRGAPEDVRLAAIRLTRQLAITNAAPILAELVAAASLSDAIRVEALNALATLDQPVLGRALATAQADPREKLRVAATRLAARVNAPGTVARLAATLEQGTTAEKQAALVALATLPDPDCDEILGRWLEHLAAGKVPKELQLDLLAAAEKRPASSLKLKLTNYEASKPKDDPLAPYREALFGGSALEGKRLFFERPEAQCVRCHKVNGQGGDVGPDLSRVGQQKDRRYLLESIVLPNQQITQGFESVLVTLKNGDDYAGVLKSETAAELTIQVPESGPLVLPKAQIQSRRNGLSPMPEGMAQILSKADLRDLVEFLSSLQ